jgi:hypothetical protein
MNPPAEHGPQGEPLPAQAPDAPADLPVAEAIRAVGSDDEELVYQGLRALLRGQVADSYAAEFPGLGEWVSEGRQAAQATSQDTPTSTEEDGSAQVISFPRRKE